MVQTARSRHGCHRAVEEGDACSTLETFRRQKPPRYLETGQRENTHTHGISDIEYSVLSLSIPRSATAWPARTAAAGWAVSRRRQRRARGCDQLERRRTMAPPNGAVFAAQRRRVCRSTPHERHPRPRVNANTTFSHVTAPAQQRASDHRSSFPFPVYSNATTPFSNATMCSFLIIARVSS